VGDIGGQPRRIDALICRGRGAWDRERSSERQAASRILMGFTLPVNEWNAVPPAPRQRSDRTPTSRGRLMLIARSSGLPKKRSAARVQDIVMTAAAKSRSFAGDNVDMSRAWE
jgi:hypothetical protein